VNVKPNAAIIMSKKIELSLDIAYCLLLIAFSMQESKILMKR